jgi:hypothetical protein
MTSAVPAGSTAWVAKYRRGWRRGNMAKLQRIRGRPLRYAQPASGNWAFCASALIWPVGMPERCHRPDLHRIHGQVQDHRGAQLSIRLFDVSSESCGAVERSRVPL